MSDIAAGKRIVVRGDEWLVRAVRKNRARRCPCRSTRHFTDPILAGLVTGLSQRKMSFSAPPVEGRMRRYGRSIVDRRPGREPWSTTANATVHG
jgi:hypothetical protein